MYSASGFMLPKVPMTRNKIRINMELDRPSKIVQSIGSSYVKTGSEWTVTDLYENLKNNNVESASLIVKDNQIEGLFAIDNKHGAEIIGDNLHALNSVPELTNGILNELNKYHINYDITDITQYSFLNNIPIVFQIVGFYIIISFIMSIVFRLLMTNNMNNPMNSGTSKSLFDQMNIFSTKYSQVNTEEINVTFNDVAGCDESKYELEEVVDFLKNPERYVDAGATIPKGVLLEGPPGTGKTLLARAVAGEAGVPFFSASGSQFIEMFVGVGASRVRELFDKANKAAPAVIFIDEIDAVGRQRGTGLAGGNDEREQTLNQILTNMDGFTKSTGIIVLAATNRADILDGALTRPGRFDRKIVVGLPDKEGREKIIKVHFRDKKVENKTDLKNIATLTTGFSGADIANLANEAAILSVRYNETFITEKCLYDAYEKITIGLPVLKENRNKETIELVAYHEIGHAMLVALFKDMFNLQKITINSNKNGAGGYTLFTPKETYNNFPTKKFMLANMIIAMGGRAAEVIIYGGSSVSNNKDSDEFTYNSKLVFPDISNLDVTTGASNDLKQANSIARNYVNLFGMGKEIGVFDLTDNSQPFLGRDLATNSNKLSEYSKKEIDIEISKLVNYAHEMAINILMKNSDTLRLVTKDLIINRTITGKELSKYSITYN
tara:strand:- start:411 stop:2411 length:2001 start_codon:yes stop_codon:yes gene_type:complete